MYSSVIEVFKKTVEKFPTNLAIEDSQSQLTFAELDRNSTAVARELREAGVVKGDAVAVLMSKSCDAVVAFLAVLKVGGYYAPLDVFSPVARIEKILGTLAPRVVITDLSIDMDGSVSEKYLELDFMTALTKGLSCAGEGPFGYETLCDLDPIYCIHTSGSTGVPKGVLISHRGVIDYIEWAIEEYKVDQNEVLGNQAPFVFDNSTLDIYLMIFTGARLVLIPEEKFKVPKSVLTYLNEKQISLVFWVPSVLVSIARLRALEAVPLTSLMKVLFAGEVMPTKHLNYWIKNLPGVLFSNLYGPTEITVDCTYHHVLSPIDDELPVPIGRECKNSSVLLLSDNNKTPWGEIGEICVRGSGLALGYVNQPEKTAEVFTPNPLNSAYYDRIYRTGDLAFYNSAGELIYVGRKDSQVKYQGYRIELGEIESVIGNINGVAEVCVYLDRRGRLSATLTGGQSLDLDAVKKMSAEGLPSYMLPTNWEVRDEMPKLPSGKVDRKVLSEK